MNAPVVLFLDDVEAEYKSFQQIILNASHSNPKLIERTTNGPIKKIFNIGYSNFRRCNTRRTCFKITSFKKTNYSVI